MKWSRDLFVPLDICSQGTAIDKPTMPYNRSLPQRSDGELTNEKRRISATAATLGNQ
jgi:hypothetical protein